MSFIHNFPLLMFLLSSVLRRALYEAVNFGIRQCFSDGLEVLWVLPRVTEQRMAEPKEQQESRTRVRRHLPHPGIPAMRFVY